MECPEAIHCQNINLFAFSSKKIALRRQYHSLLCGLQAMQFLSGGDAARRNSDGADAD